MAFVTTPEIKTIGVLVNPRKSRARNPLSQLDQWLHLNRPPVRFLLCAFNSPYIKDKYNYLEHAGEAEVIKESDAIISLGGDGSILRAVQSVGNLNIPILGVNLGGLGFLAEIPPDLFINQLDAFIKGNYVLEERTLLNCVIPDSGETFFALNDMVFDKAGFSRVIEIVTHVDGKLLNSYIADAMILSTPTGSTGYSLSAGGPIVIPQTRVFLINPICPHSLTNRPVLVSDQCRISLQVNTEFEEVHFFRDGQQMGAYPSGTVFEVSKADFKIRMVRIQDHDFFETLRNKLHWGEDFRDKQRWTYKG